MRPSLLLALTLAAGARAQSVWTPASGADLTALFAQAAPGDIVLLAGWHAPFVLNKGLVLIGPASIYFNWGMPAVVYDSTISIPAGQQARLVGVTFQQSSSTPGGVRGQTVTVSGNVSIEDCSFGPGVPEALVIPAGSVVMHHCTVLWGGMLLLNGTCSMTDCTLNGRPASFHNLGGLDIPALPALSQTGGTLVASHVTATGGAAYWSYHFVPPAPAFACSGAACFLTDSALAGGSGITWNLPGPGAAALAGNAGTAIARNTLTGGAGTVTGAPFTGAVQNTPQLVGMRIDHGLQFGQTSIATAIAGSTQQLLAIVGGFAATAANVPPVIGPVFGQPGQLVTLVLSVPAASAAVPVAVVVPNDLALRGVGLWLQAFQLDAPFVRASAVVGGAIH